MHDFREERTDGMCAMDDIKFTNLTASVINHIPYIPH